MIRANAKDAAIPELPARYAPRELIGEGATGAVWRAWDNLLEVDVAVKVARANLAVHPRFRALFAREVATGARVVHPRVVPVYDSGLLADGVPFVSLAYADRGSLGDLLRAKAPLSDVLRLIDQVLEALAHLHARNILHQDLKPENVLLHTVDGGVDAWLADLGVAVEMAELVRERKSISGTPSWMAPEQLMGQAQELGPWTDLYAVGLLLQEALGGDHVSAVIGRRELLEARMEGSRLGDDVPAALSAVVGILLDPDPRQRYDRAADVRRALRQAVVGLDMQFAGRLVESESVARRSTSFDHSLVPEAMVSIASPRPSADGGRVPRWNRVPPEAMPARFPADPDGGAPTRTSQALFALREPPLIGRERGRQQLWDAARAVVRDGEARVVLVVGSAGSGKSRLVEAVARALDEGGYMESLSLRYQFPAGVDDGYRGAVREVLAPWNESRDEAVARLRRWLARDWQMSREAVGAEAAVLARWCGFLPEKSEPVNAAVGLSFLYRYLDVRAWRGGACLLLEDAHLAQAEGDGLAICEALLERSVGERPVLAMVTIASEALASDPVLRHKVDSLLSRGATQIDATRLTEPEMRRLLEGALHLSPDLADAVLPRVEGSPSMAALMVREWATRGALTIGADGRFKLRADLRIAAELSADLASLCDARVAGVVRASSNTSAAAEALAAMALAGPEPPAMVVRDVAGAGVDALLAAGIIHQRGWRLVFEHIGVQRAARRVAQRRVDVVEMHARLADAWARVGARMGASVDLPHGMHRLNAGQADQALGPLSRAARTFLAEGRSSLAEDAARLAVAAADRVGIHMGRIETRLVHAEALLEQERVGDARQVLVATRSLGHQDRRTAARVQLLQARCLVSEGDFAEARRLLKQASLAFEALRDRQGQVETSHGLGVVARLAGNPDGAIDAYLEALELVRGDRRAEVLALQGLVEARVSAGRLRDVDPYIDRLRRVASESGDTRNIAHATYVAGMVHLRRRRLDDAERYLRTARALAATLGADRLHLAAQNNLGEVYRYRGDTRSAETCYRWTARFAEERGWGTIAAVARLDLALVAMAKGAGRLARIEVDRAAEQLASTPSHWAWQVVGLLRALRAAEDKDEAACRHWWGLAVAQGIGGVPSPDFWLPLERLASTARLHDWADVAAHANEIARRLAVHDDPDLDLEIEEE